MSTSEMFRASNEMSNPSRVFSAVWMPKSRNLLQWQWVFGHIISNFTQLIVIFFVQSEFCPVFCKEDEQLCPGTWDHETGENLSPDICIPMKNGTCYNYCPETNCGENELVCSGGLDAEGCKIPDFCHYGSKLYKPNLYKNIIIINTLFIFNLLIF